MPSARIQEAPSPFIKQRPQAQIRKAAEEAVTHHEIERAKMLALVSIADSFAELLNLMERGK